MGHSYPPSGLSTTGMAWLNINELRGGTLFIDDTAVSLNDPFGRVSRRRQQGYDRLREQLRTQGIAAEDTVQHVLDGLNRTALILAASTVALAVLAALLFRAAQAIATVCAVLALIWIGSSYAQTRSHLTRYRNELADPTRPARTVDCEPKSAEDQKR